MEPTSLPIWLSCGLAILAGLGGFEFIKWIATLTITKRKEKAGATSAEAEAAKANAEAQLAQLEIYKDTIEYCKKQAKQISDENNLLRADINELKTEFKEFKEAARKKQSEDAQKIADLERKVKGLQTAKTKAEAFYCEVAKCKDRRPPLGTYHTELTPALR